MPTSLRFLFVLVFLASSIHFSLPLYGQPSILLKVITAGREDMKKGKVIPPAVSTGSGLEPDLEQVAGTRPPTVMFRIQLDATGVIRSAQPLDSRGGSLAQKLAQEELLATTFRPGLVDGKPTETWGIVYVALPDTGVKGKTEIDLLRLFSPTLVNPYYSEDSLYSHLDYPVKGIEEGLEGNIYIRATVNNEGKIRRTEVVNRDIYTLDHKLWKKDRELFDEAAINAVKNLTCIPGTELTSEGIRSISMTMIVPVRFRFDSASREGKKKELIEAGKLKELVPVKTDDNFPSFVLEENRGMNPEYDSKELSRLLEFPPEAKKQKLEGIFYVKVRLNRHGDVLNVRIIQREGIGTEDFDGVVISAAQRIPYSPAFQNGYPLEDFTLGIPIQVDLD